MEQGPLAAAGAGRLPADHVHRPAVPRDGLLGLAVMGVRDVRDPGALQEIATARRLLRRGFAEQPDACDAAFGVDVDAALGRRERPEPERMLRVRPEPHALQHLLRSAGQLVAQRHRDRARLVAREPPRADGDPVHAGAALEADAHPVVRVMVELQRRVPGQHPGRPVPPRLIAPVPRAHVREFAPAIPGRGGKHGLVGVGEVGLRVGDQEGRDGMGAHGIVRDVVAPLPALARRRAGVAWGLEPGGTYTRARPRGGIAGGGAASGVGVPGK